MGTGDFIQIYIRYQNCHCKFDPNKLVGLHLPKYYDGDDLAPIQLLFGKCNGDVVYKSTCCQRNVLSLATQDDLMRTKVSVFRSSSSHQQFVRSGQEGDQRGSSEKPDTVVFLVLPLFISQDGQVVNLRVKSDWSMLTSLGQVKPPKPEASLRRVDRALGLGSRLHIYDRQGSGWSTDVRHDLPRQLTWYIRALYASKSVSLVHRSLCLGSFEISEVMSGTFTEERLGNGRQIHVNLTDFDNDVTMIGSPVKSLNTSKRALTGTSIFIARPISEPLMGYLVEQSARNPPVIIEQFDIAKDSSHASDDNAYERWKEFVSTVQMKLIGIPDDSDVEVMHQEWHDMESVYWIMVLFFLRAIPMGNQPKRTITANTKGWNAISKYQVGSVYDPRNYFEIGDKKGFWEGSLHGNFRAFSPLLAAMTRYIFWPWDAISLEAHKFHAHHAFQRLILRETCIRDQADLHVRLEHQPLRCTMSFTWCTATHNRLVRGKGTPPDSDPPKRQNSSTEVNGCYMSN
ncbi:hypothetical protein BD410DRAFT_174663 [Rickenella mellea]|uniref:Fungal-type protein kinase domain-containing protein n=1 Tax=Rickenella mellea TaxID=50990 RepID=A0A4Y7Q6E7_9AGAM|nr:hypothetical protein BD410DRAFT_174663 [Rickenella mellea]